LLQAELPTSNKHAVQAHDARFKKNAKTHEEAELRSGLALPPPPVRLATLRKADTPTGGAAKRQRLCDTAASQSSAPLVIGIGDTAFEQQSTSSRSALKAPLWGVPLVSKSYADSGGKQGHRVFFRPPDSDVRLYFSAAAKKKHHLKFKILQLAADGKRWGGNPAPKLQVAAALSEMAAWLPQNPAVCQLICVRGGPEMAAVRATVANRPEPLSSTMNDFISTLGQVAN
jgi:hypothetical protein